MRRQFLTWLISILTWWAVWPLDLLFILDGGRRIKGDTQGLYLLEIKELMFNKAS